ncbi:MAG: autotransporter-associated beta strand repeat-containing protein, partial [Akkermansiaceae bacterium]|nr:autotransporter-associated beta strand repeat-containing protein [Luteolibacter sp.]
MRIKAIPCLTVSALLSIFSQSFAADGTWDTDSAGNWTDITKWFGDTAYASGTDATATFGNIITADRTITLDALITIGNITASDTTHNYTISGANTLTLDRTAGVPTIDVVTARTLTIGSQLAGNDGLKKTGAGTLVFTSTSNNTFSGGIEINAGTILYSSITHANAWGDAANVITFTGNASLHNADLAYTLARSIAVNNSVTATLSGAFGESTNITGAVTGAGDVNINSNSNGYAVTMSHTANTLSGSIWLASGTSSNATLTVNSLADGADSSKRLKMGNGAALADFTLQGSPAAPLIWTNRAVELAGTTGAISIRNNSSQTLTISRDLLFTEQDTENRARG